MYKALIFLSNKPTFKDFKDVWEPCWISTTKFIEICPFVFKVPSWTKVMASLVISSRSHQSVGQNFPCMVELPFCCTYLWCCPSPWPWTWRWAPAAPSASSPACGSRPWADPPRQRRSCGWWRPAVASRRPPWSSAPSGSPAWAEYEHLPTAAGTPGPGCPPRPDPAGRHSEGHKTTTTSRSDHVYIFMYHIFIIITQ